MTIATIAASSTATIATPSRTVEKRRAAFSLRDFFNVLAKSFMMARVIPNTGRVNAKQVAKVRSMMDSL